MAAQVGAVAAQVGVAAQGELGRGLTGMPVPCLVCWVIGVIRAGAA